MSADPISELETRCRERPDDPAALFDLAGAYEHAGDLGHAFLTYSKAIEKNWGAKSWIDFHLRFYADALAAQERVYGEIEKRAQENPQPAWRAYWAIGLASISTPMGKN
jgi:tetratricopeptide (TPR) repeat protein